MTLIDNSYLIESFYVTLKYTLEVISISIISTEVIITIYGFITFWNNFTDVILYHYKSHESDIIIFIFYKNSHFVIWYLFYWPLLWKHVLVTFSAFNDSLLNRTSMASVRLHQSDIIDCSVTLNPGEISRLLDGTPNKCIGFKSTVQGN